MEGKSMALAARALRESAIFGLLGLGPLVAGCNDLGSATGNILLDASIDARDANSTDGPIIIDVASSDAFDAPGDVGSDAGCDARCVSEPNPCIVVSGCACTITPRPDGTSCGSHGETCSASVCTPPAPGCGSGWRDLVPTREGCDDGNTEDGDACSSGCTPTLLVIASPPGEEASTVSAAADGEGNMLFAWVESIPATASTERTLSARAAIYSATGVLSVPAFDLETGLPIGGAVTPVAAGLATGWAVAWRSTTIEGRDADLGGIAYAVIDVTGTRGRVRQANTEERFDQREPSIAPFEEGFAIAWTDGSDRPADPGLGIRLRTFDARGLPAGWAAAEVAFAGVTEGDQSQPSLAGVRGSSELALGFTDASTGMPIAHLRRTADATAHPLTDRWSSNPSVVLLASGEVWAGWVQPLTSPLDPGSIFAQLVSPTDLPDIAGGMVFGTVQRNIGVTVAARDALTPVVGWHTDDRPQGLQVKPYGWSFPAEETELLPLLRGARQRDLRLVATDDGLWLTWTDESPAGATSSVVAYLLPWN